MLADAVILTFSLATAWGLVKLVEIRARVRAPGLWIAALGLAPVIWIYLVNPNHRVYSYHGFLHSSIVYQILENGIPPPNPFYAGEPLLYPWGFHTVAAALVSALGISPPWAFALLNVGALALVLALTYRIATALSDDPGTRLLSLVVPLFAFTCFHRGPLQEALTWLLGGGLDFGQEARVTPLVRKFTNSNGVPLGVLGLAGFLSSLISFYGEGRSRRGRLFDGAALGVATVFCGFVYPLIFLSLAAGAGAVFGYMMLRGDRAQRARTWWGAAVFGLAALSLAPYFLAFAGPKQGGAGIHASFDLARVAARGAKLALTLSPLALAAALAGAPGRRRWRPSSPAFVVLVATAATSVVLYLLIVVPTGASYKPLIALIYAAGILACVPFATLCRRSRLAAVAILAALLVPQIHLVSKRMTLGRHLPVHYHERGADLVPADPEELALVRWIGADTTPDAVFVDSRLQLPVYARRQLYIGLDDGRPPPGLGLRMNVFLLQSNGYDPESFRKRRWIARRIVSADPDGVTRRILGELDAAFPERPVYLVAREPGARRELRTEDRLRLAFEHGTLAVFELVRPPG